MNIYCYDETTKEYLITRKADADPEETRIQGRFIPLVPANSTLIAIPEYRENEIPVFENGQWVVKPDYRKNFYKVDESFNVREIETIGEQEGFYVVDKAVGDAIKQNPDKFKIVDDEIVKKSDEEYEQDQEQREQLRIAGLNLTKADVLLALYQDKGLTPDDIKSMLKDNVPALIKFDYASAYYRGDDVVNALGLALGYTKEEMDYLFENKAFPPKVEEPADTDSDSDTDVDSDTDTDLDSDTDNDTEQTEEENENTTDTDTNTVPDEVEQPSDTTENTDTDNAG